MYDIGFSLFTCESLYSVIQCDDFVPQIFHPYKGLFFNLVHFFGCTAAATLAIESTIAVPVVTGQRSFPLDWNMTEGMVGSGNEVSVCSRMLLKMSAFAVLTL